jgi:two-component system OmpR family sensor kinase
LAEQLLALARAEPDAGAVKEAVDLRMLLADCVAAHAPIAQRAGIDLGFEQAQAATVTANADSLRVMFGNLLDNAVKYTPAGGRIDVSLSTEADGANPCVQIADSGPGIPAEERSRVFDRFYRDASARARTDVSGSGLGLAIVKRVATQHNASIELGDAPLGGLLVTVRF